MPTRSGTGLLEPGLVDYTNDGFGGGDGADLGGEEVSLGGPKVGVSQSGEEIQPAYLVCGGVRWGGLVGRLRRPAPLPLPQEIGSRSLFESLRSSVQIGALPAGVLRSRTQRCRQTRRPSAGVHDVTTPAAML